MSEGLKLLVDGHHGVYVPEVFATNYDLSEWSINPDEALELQDVDNEYYWDVWDDVLSYATYTDKDGHEWFLYQDSDLWAVCPELLTEEEYLDFFGESKESY